MKRSFAALLLVAACGGKSSPPPTAPLPDDKVADGPTCKDVGDHATEAVNAQLPPGAPAEFPAEFGAMVAGVCTEDAWSAEVITCYATADDPRDACSPKLTTDQQTHLDAEEGRMTKELMAALAASAGNDLSTPTGMASCDQLRAYGAQLRDCPAVVAEMGQDQLDQMIAGLAMLTAVPADQQAEVDEQCKAGLGQLGAVVTKYKCD